MMQFRLSPQEGFMLATLDGLVSLEAWQAVLPGIQRAIEPLNTELLVIDMMGVVGWLGTPERTAVGGLMAHCFASLKKVAVVVQAAKITGVVEAEAQRHGVNLRLFSQFNQAAAWVKAE